jgi:L-threonylcarbamoyladenylate synthase
VSARIVAPTPEAVAAAAARLAAGALVAFPTETVYGLGADAGNAEAVRAIFAAKGRPADHPVIVHIGSGAGLAHWARAVPPGARALAAAFWPGPLTLILPRAAHVDDAVTGGQDSVGLRVPSHPVAQALLAAFASRGGAGIAAPSANRFGRISPTTARHVADDLGGAVDTILDGGRCEVGIESTIVAFAGDTPLLLRPGGIGVAALVRVLGRAPAVPGARPGDPSGDPAGTWPGDSAGRGADPAVPRASGTLASHYAPHTPARLVPADRLRAEIAPRLARDQRVAVLARTVARPADFSGIWIAAPEDAARYAHDLYANLRTLDAAEADDILIEAPPDAPDWLAVTDRVTRAAHGDDDDRD